MQTLSTTRILADATQLCQQRNVRLTPQRAEVLRLMAEHATAISAYDLLDKLRLSEPQAKPPTVYRALEFLLEQGFIHRIESTNSYVVCLHFNLPFHTFVMLICDHCNSVSEQQIKGIEQLINQQAKRNGFKLRHSVVETHGLCASCLAVEQCTNKAHCQHDHTAVIPTRRGSRHPR